MTDRAQLEMAIKEVFLTKGYAGATLNHLAEACGLSKASLYHHFPGGKEEMAAILLRQAAGDLTARTASALQAAKHMQGAQAAARRLEHFVDGFTDYLKEGSQGCLLASFAQTDALAELEPEFAETLRTQMGEWLSALEDVIGAMGVGTKKARRLAAHTLSSLYGALTVTQLTGETKTLNRVSRELKRQLAQYAENNHAES